MQWTCDSCGDAEELFEEEYCDQCGKKICQDCIAAEDDDHGVVTCIDCDTKNRLQVAGVAC